jgi:hypothetical protein
MKFFDEDKDGEVGVLLSRSVWRSLRRWWRRCWWSERKADDVLSIFIPHN